MTIYKYKAKNGKEYNCKIIKKYDYFLDIQLVEEDDDSIFLKVPKSMITRV